MVFKNRANIKNRPSYEGLFFYVEIKFSLVQQRQGIHLNLLMCHHVFPH